MLPPPPPPVIHNFRYKASVEHDNEYQWISYQREVVYHRGEQHRIRKSLKLYIVLQKNALVDIKISIIDIFCANTARYLKLWWFLYFINEKLNKNAKVEKLTTKLGRGVGLIVIGPFMTSRHECLKTRKRY